MNDAVEAATLEIENALRRPERSRPVIHIEAPELMPEPQAIIEEKLDYTLVPLDALDEIVRTLMYGKEKHGAWNWVQNPLNWNELLAKAQRHIFAFTRGEDIDPASGKSHLACAVCDLMFLQSNIISGRSQDNRFKP